MLVGNRIRKKEMKFAPHLLEHLPERFVGVDKAAVLVAGFVHRQQHAIHLTSAYDAKVREMVSKNPLQGGGGGRT